MGKTAIAWKNSGMEQ